MNDLFIGLIPALGWGIQSIVMQKVGGKFTNKVMGMVSGTVLFAIVVFLFRRPDAITGNLIWGSLLCGIFWSVGQLLQVKAFDMVGVSRAIPISTGEQLLGTALVGILYFHEWTTGRQYTLGLIALVLIIVGISLTAIKENSADGQGSQIGSGLLLLTVSSIGFIGYAVIPRLFGLNGWDMLLPQAIAMFISTATIVHFIKGNDMWGAKTWQNISTGLCFAVANLTILLSNELNGVAVGFTLSQLNVIVATLGGLFILHERKTHKELVSILAGLTLVVIGAVLIGMTKS